MGGEAGLVLGTLLGEVEVQRAVADPLDDRRELIGGDRADGVDRGAEAGVRRLAQPGDALRPARRVAVGEALLGAR